MLPLATALRIASRIACVIVIVSFAIFVVEQTGKASNQQQNALTGTSKGSAPPAIHAKRTRKGTVHKVIDEVASKLTSPFSAITAGSKSQWAIRGVGTVLALLIYGIGIGYLTRIMRYRV